MKNKKPKLLQTVIVEGKYDKIKLDSILDANIIVTHGFSIFKNPETLSLIQKLAAQNGIVIFTDSDRAGFLIRNFVKRTIPKGQVKEAYIPEILGKEKRKALPSKEGKLGVEGVSRDIIIDVLKKAGCTFADDAELPPPPQKSKIKKIDLYNLGLIGQTNSTELRKLFLEKLNLPKGLSTNALVDVLNTLFTEDEFATFLENDF